MPLIRRAWAAAPLRCRPQPCIRPQWQLFYTLRPLNDNQDTRRPPPLNAPPPPPATPEGPPIPAPPPPRPAALEGAPRSYGKKVVAFTPKPLDRPIGLANPPKAGENTGIDTRTWGQKLADWKDGNKLKEKHEKTHAKIVTELSTPYFREWSNLSHHAGKTFLCPRGIFRSDLALYFPNLRGKMLLTTGESTDTTPVLEDKVSVVCIYSGLWAQKQIATLTAKKVNPELHRFLDGNSDIVQFVEINVETQLFRRCLVEIFRENIKKQIDEKNWGRYFLMKRNADLEIREAIGLLNTKVGYTYLLDSECRIRWAACGPASEQEKASLVKSAKRLVDDARSRTRETRTGTQKALSSTIKTAATA